jgi:molybdopterin-synthase adenylyltransferase
MDAEISNKINKNFERYQRQISLNDFGKEGQEKLKNSRVLIAGAGGLGSVVSIYLAAAGIGTIGLIDNDTVEISNLNRQILYGDSDIGTQKVIAAKKRLQNLNPGIDIRDTDVTIDEGTIDSVTAGYDVIVDAMDNFPARFLLNRAAIKRNIPFIHGAVSGFEGRATTIIPGETPCLKCINPRVPELKPPPVLGVTPAVIGSIQATEVIKYIIKTGKLLTGRLLVYDGLTMEFMIVKIKKNPDCPECGSR